MLTICCQFSQTSFVLESFRNFHSSSPSNIASQTQTHCCTAILSRLLTTFFVVLNWPLRILKHTVYEQHYFILWHTNYLWRLIKLQFRQKSLFENSLQYLPHQKTKIFLSNMLVCILMALKKPSAKPLPTWFLF